MSTGHFLVLFSLLAAGSTAQRSKHDALLEFSGRTMGTTYHIKLANLPDDVSREKLDQKIEALLLDINHKMSTYDPDSELSRFNESRSTDWFKVSKETVRVVDRALEIADLSDGAFDPTVAPLIRLWHFDRDAGALSLPTEVEIGAALETVGYQKIRTQTNPPALRKSHPRTELNLSAIAKGYAVDRVAELLLDHGITGSLVEIGGEVRTCGTKPDGSPWVIGIEKPIENQRRLAYMLPLSNRSIATSGDYRNTYEIHGVHYSHTIDPVTGKPVTHQLASVTVLANDCMTADALATTLMVLGEERGKTFADQHGIPAWMLLRQGTRLRSVAVGGFPKSSLIRVDSSGQASEAKKQSQPRSSNWITFVVALAVFLLAITGMAAGMIFSKRCLTGTCGGLAGLKDEQGRPMCEHCSTPPEQCEKFRQMMAQSSDPPSSE